MSKITYELTIKGLPYAISKERQEDPEFKRNILLALFPECAESQAIVIAEKKFGQKFYPMPYNWKGWDIISEDKSIKIEVKQTSVMGTSSDLSINATWSKKDLCTHIMIFDFFNPTISISIMSFLLVNFIVMQNYGGGIQIIKKKHIQPDMDGIKKKMWYCF